MLFAEPPDVGVDPSPQSVAEARRNRAYNSVAVASATTLPFPDAAFGGVLSNCVLEHIPDLRSALGEISRVLAPGGTFATTVPSAYHTEMLLGARLPYRLGLPSLGEQYRRWFTAISKHYHMYDVPEWGRLLASVGLDLVQHCYYFSPRTVAAFELGHYLSAPSLATRRLTGKWVLWPGRAKTRLLASFLRRYYDEPAPARGAYIFLVARHV
jgi:SAM-dependent methyltransferase